MKTFTLYLKLSAVYFFILLFCYAAISKALDFENFQVQIGQSPLLSAYAGMVSYAVIFAELIIVLLLVFDATRLYGLYASTAVMSAFTIYIYLILNYSDFVPCSCGGILEKMGWTEHLILNIACVLFGGVAVWISEKEYGRPSFKTGILLLISNIVACCFVIILFLRSEYIVKKENNFTRRFLMIPTIASKTIDLDHSAFYFAGSDNHHIYLGNTILPQNLLIIDSSLGQKTNTKIDLEMKKYHFKKIEIKVNSPYYYIYDGTVPVIYQGKLGVSSNNLISYNDAFFNQMEVINDSKIVICTQSSKTKNLILGQILINRSGKNKVSLFSGLLEKQLDGVFDSDGQLSYDPITESVNYIYTYRNQFLVMDPLMQLKNRLSTIDTTKTAQIQVTPLSDGRYKMSKPAIKVNGNAFSYKGLLFNPAQLRGKNESLKKWNENKVIDIYRTDSQNYIGSMYIEDVDKSSITGMRITDKHLYVIAGKKLIQYRLTSSLTKHFNNGEAEKRIQE